MAVPPHVTAPSQTTVHMAFSGNWAAVAGIIVCVFLLCLWFELTALPTDEENGPLG